MGETLGEAFVTNKKGASALAKTTIDFNCQNIEKKNAESQLIGDYEETEGTVIYNHKPRREF